MSKSAVVIIGAASAIALVSFVLWPHTDKPTLSSQRQNAEFVAAAEDSQAGNAIAIPQVPAVPTVVARRTTPEPPTTEIRKLEDAAILITRLRELAATDPQLSSKLAREAADRFPDSSYHGKMVQRGFVWWSHLRERGIKESARIWILLVIGLCVSGTASAAPYRVPDPWITAEAKMSLWTSGGIRSDALKVDTSDGTVTLYGKVDSAGQKKKAVDLTAVPEA